MPADQLSLFAATRPRPPSSAASYNPFPSTEEVLAPGLALAVPGVFSLVVRRRGVWTLERTMSSRPTGNVGTDLRREPIADLAWALVSPRGNVVEHGRPSVEPLPGAVPMGCRVEECGVCGTAAHVYGRAWVGDGDARHVVDLCCACTVERVLADRAAGNAEPPGYGWVPSVTAVPLWRECDCMGEGCGRCMGMGTLPPAPTPRRT